MPLIIPANTISGGYEVANSLRFNDGSSDYLSRTPSSASNRKTWTFSTWVKLGNIGTEKGLLHSESDSNNFTAIRFSSDHRFKVLSARSGSTANGFYLITTRLFRDPSAWYHIVVAVDTTLGTATNRVRIYVNGVEETAFDTDDFGASQNYDTDINATSQQNVGDDNSGFHDGYLAETVLVDGSQLTPTSFGEFDEDSGIWKPKDVSGLTFGTNGFYLDFKDSSALGNDANGSNNFTVNNLTAIDQSTDTCTNNFATLNPLFGLGAFTFSEGNLVADDGSNSDTDTISTIGVSQGKWYLEFKIIDQGIRGNLGFTDGVDRGLAEGNIRSSPAKYGYYSPAYSTSSYTSGTVNSNLGTSTDNDIICMAFDADNGQLFMSKNGNIDTSSTASITGITTGNIFHFFFNETAGGGALSGYSLNFGSPAYSISSGNSDGNGYGNFEYAVPSGYYSLNSKNLAEYG